MIKNPVENFYRVLSRMALGIKRHEDRVEIVAEAFADRKKRRIVMRAPAAHDKNIAEAFAKTGKRGKGAS